MKRNNYGHGLSILVTGLFLSLKVTLEKHFIKIVVAVFEKI